MKKGSRAAAFLLAVIAWTGLAVQFSVDIAANESFFTALVAELAFFTIIINLLVAVQFSGVALGFRGFDTPRAVAGAALSVALVGVIYHVLLAKLYHLKGAAIFSNLLTHGVVPVLTPLYWLAFTPKGKLQSRDLLLWCAYPLVYLAYALCRSSITGVYPYPFIDVSKIGWPATIRNAVFIAAAFLAAGWVLLRLDARLGRLQTGARSSSS